MTGALAVAGLAWVAVSVPVAVVVGRAMHLADQRQARPPLRPIHSRP
ncbi:hypothetical protein [Blastococcus sp. CT_GayMR16]|nr:hypothetical protein [Blastococcus sp. CT_GayMR16]